MEMFVDLSSEERKISYDEFLESNFIKLRTDGSSRTYYAHEALIRAKCKAVDNAWARKLKEERDGVYTFYDVSDGTLARFIEWAYTGKYPAQFQAFRSVSIRATPTAIDSRARTFPTSRAIGKAPIQNGNSSNGALTQKNSDLDEEYWSVAHAKVYIFAEIYLIAKLKSLAFEGLVEELSNIHVPLTPSGKTEVISLLELAFSNLREEDQLLELLGRFTAGCVEDIRTHPAFDELQPKIKLLAHQQLKPKFQYITRNNGF